MNEFYITLSSDSSYDIYPDNKLSSFQNVLAQPVNLGENERWTCALAELLYPTGYESLSVPLNMNEEVDENVLILRGLQKVTFPQKAYASVNELYETIKQSMKVSETILELFLIELQKNPGRTSHGDRTNHNVV